MTKIYTFSKPWYTQKHVLRLSKCTDLYGSESNFPSLKLMAVFFFNDIWVNIEEFGTFVVVSFPSRESSYRPVH